MARKLLDLVLEEISLVDSPANPGAKILLAKRAPVEKDDTPVQCRLCDMPVEKDDKFCKGCGAPFYKDLSGQTRGDLSDADFAAVWTDAQGNKQRKLPINDAAHVRNALARFDQTDMPENIRAHARARLVAAAHRFGIDESKETKAMKDKTETTDAEVEKLLAELTKNDEGSGSDITPEARALKALAFKLVGQKRLAEFTKKAEAMKFLPGTTTPKLAELLKEIAEASPEVYEKLEPLFKSWSEAFEMSALFSEQGSGADAAASAEERVTALAQDRIKKGLAKTMAEAQGQVFRADPALYRQYRKETSIAV